MFSMPRIFMLALLAGEGAIVGRAQSQVKNQKGCGLLRPVFLP
jgi:hypothetical protein